MGKLPSTPANHRLYVIGDIHGRADLLTKLLKAVERNAADYPDKQKKLIFLGDYVDRGLHSKDVIERLTQPLPEGMEGIFLRGNHEEKLMEVLDGLTEDALAFLRYGGDATFSSYGVPVKKGLFGKDIDATIEKFINAVPKHHKDFLNSTLFYISFGDYYFVHAGVRPGVLLHLQNRRDQLWIRQDFIPSTYKFEKMIVHGHTITEKPVALPNRIGIDTGAYATGHLTCLILDGTERKLLRT